MSTAVELRPYRCHTVVQAFRIERVQQKPSAKSTWNGEWELVPEGDAAHVTVDNMWYLTQRPVAGGYYVVDARGTATFVAREIFEREWSEVPDA